VFAERSGAAPDVLRVSGTALAESAHDESHRIDVRHHSASDETDERLTRDGLLHMMFKLGQRAEKTWRRLRGFRQLAQVIEGIQFVNGIEETTIDPVAA
jgi:putative transposase